MGCFESKDEQRKQPIHQADIGQNNNNNQTVKYGFEDQYKQKGLDVQVIRHYLQLNKTIKQFEQNHPILAHGDKTKRLEYVQGRLADLEKKIVLAKDNIEQQVVQVQMAHQVLDESGASAKELVSGLVTKEEAELIQAQQTLGLLEADFEKLTKECYQLTADLAPISAQADQLKRCYLEQDALLRSVFDGQYGSKEENRIERQVDDLADLRARIEAANIRWTSAANVVNTAAIQAATGLSAWSRLQESNNNNVVYAAATEANSNLNAAIKNVQLVINYVSGIKLPYVKEPDIANAIELIRGGLASRASNPETTAKVRQCFEEMRQKCVQLETWMKRVVGEIIDPDAADTDARLHEAEERLHAERLRLMLGRAVQLGTLAAEEKNLLEMAVREAEESVKAAAQEVERTSAAANPQTQTDPDQMRKVAFDVNDPNAPPPSGPESARRREKVVDDGEFEAVRLQLRKQMAAVERKDESVKTNAERDLAERLQQRKWRRVQAASAAKEAHRETIPQQ